MKTLYILRHGKTIWNKERKAQGRTDVPLSDEGRKEAYKVKEYIESLNIDGIYSSPLKRALETAEIVSQDISYKIFKTDDDLIERSFGHYEGELVEKLPFSILTKENPEFDGEGVDESADRFKKCFEKDLAKYSEKLKNLNYSLEKSELYKRIFKEKYEGMAKCYFNCS